MSTTDAAATNLAAADTAAAAPAGDATADGATVTSRRRRKTGRPPLTDSGTLLAAAREIGFEKLTVGAVTTKVGVKYSTFYRHYRSLDALVAALVDAVLAEASWPAQRPPDPAQWRPYLSALATTMTTVIGTHPALAAAIAKLPKLPQRLQQALDDATQALRDAGTNPTDAAVTARALVRDVLSIDLPPRPPDDTDSARRDEVAAQVELALDGLSHRLAAGT